MWGLRKYFPLSISPTLTRMNNFKNSLSKKKQIIISLTGVIIGLLLILPFYWDKHRDSLTKPRTKLEPPGVIVHGAVGGVGNQLFIFACSYALAKNLQIPLYLEIPSENTFYHQSETFYHSNTRPYVLHKFGLRYDLSFQGRWPSKYPVFSSRDRDLMALYQDGKPLPKDKLIIINDYCQSEAFFKNHTKEIKEMFQLQFTPEELDRGPFRYWIDVIKGAGDNSVGIHIRRGDAGKRRPSYMKFNYWLTPISFYQRGIKMMLLEILDSSKNVSFFVFSDEIELIKPELLKGLNLPPTVTLHFVSCDKCTTSLEDFYLMTLCHHMITGNSTFSWWAAWLIKNIGKVIISPAFHPKVLRDYGSDKENKFKRMELDIFYPKEWIVLDPFKDEKISN